MAIEFSWWNKDPVEGKYQVNASIHGGNIEWTRHQGHHTSWEPHTPSDEDRAQLIAAAGKRLPRRQITQQQFDQIKRLSENAGPGKIFGRRNRPGWEG